MKMNKKLRLGMTAILWAGHDLEARVAHEQRYDVRAARKWLHRASYGQEVRRPQAAQKRGLAEYISSAPPDEMVKVSSQYLGTLIQAS